MVVFVGESRFKTDMPDNVTYGLGYIRYIKSFKTKVLSPDQIVRIVDSIDEGRLTPSFKTHRAHARQVQEAVREKQNSIACPMCGSEMVLRRSKKGGDQNAQFRGCSRYLRCRGIVNMPERDCAGHLQVLTVPILRV